jgi:Ricin-type beta-trefoil lectin domain
MMRGIRRLVVYGAVTGLLAAGAVSASLETAHADQVGQCTGDGGNTVAWECTINETVPSLSALTVTVTDDTANEDVAVNVTTLSCTYGTDTQTEQASGETAQTPFTYNVSPLPLTAQTGTCDVVVTMSLPSTDPAPLTDYVATLNYTPIASATPTPTPTTTSTSSSSPVHPIKGYGGMCVDDKGNSSANGAEVVIWGCSSTDQAQSWSFSSNELIHNGKCLNDKANGGSGSKLILYSCNGGSNEKWSELANGELKLQAHSGTLCADDPRSSTKNGTQLIVYACKDSANQKWKLP